MWRGVVPLTEYLEKALACERPPEPREEVAFALYGQSFAAPDPDSRFLLLMTAIEVLIDQKERPSDVLDHVNDMVRLTEASGITENEKRSILGSLSWLRTESIGQAGRRLAATLEPKCYGDLPAVKFFSDCYTVRSLLVHGMLPLPSREQTNALGGELTRFVGDLLSRDLSATDT